MKIYAVNISEKNILQLFYFCFRLWLYSTKSSVASNVDNLVLFSQKSKALIISKTIDYNFNLKLGEARKYFESLFLIVLPEAKQIMIN